MEEAIRKAAVLIEALPYIRAFRGKVFVIKFGGSAMENMATRDCVLDDVVFLQAVGVRTVIVHGGGPEITREMKARNIQPRFVGGHRVTDEATLEIVREVLGNRINTDICDRLRQLGGVAAAFNDPTRGVIRAQRRLSRIPRPDGGFDQVDLGLVGDVEGIDGGAFLRALDAGQAPVVCPLGRGAGGEILNINGDMAAAWVAAELKAEKAVFLTDSHGILTDRSNPKSFAGTLTETQIAELVQRGVIDGGMLPKVDACLTAIRAGVHKAHIVDGRLKHSLLLEIFTDEGVGTQIVH